MVNPHHEALYDGMTSPQKFAAEDYHDEVLHRQPNSSDFWRRKLIKEFDIHLGAKRRTKFREEHDRLGYHTH